MKRTFKNKVLDLGLNNKSNKIFGIGLPKTGTNSLNESLKILGYRSIHYPLVYVYSNILSIPISSWETSLLQCRDAISGERVKPHRLAKIDNCSFGQWDALTNFGEHIYPSLDKYFPNSKFILTIRDKKSWLESTKNHFYKSPTFGIDGEPIRGKLRLMMRKYIYGCVEHDEERFSISYDDHKRNVKHYFRDRPDDLLVMDICDGEGWEKLCAFLGKDIPKDLFPCRNVTPQRFRQTRR